MADHSRTFRELAKITDPGLFERLATSVLRLGCPELYSNLTHPGMNSKGRTVKSPVDGLSFVPNSDPLHMVIAHHSTVERDDLRNKWLLDPKNVKHRAKSSTPTPGDVIKAIELFEKFKRDNPGTKATLALTTNREPDHLLHSDVVSFGKNKSISIDVWSASRIADILDNTPKGQWLRKEYLGIEQQLLSEELLHEISRKSLNKLNHATSSDDVLIDREIDSALDYNLFPLVFLVGESGMGKTTIARKYLKRHVEGSGFALVFNAGQLAEKCSIEKAIYNELNNHFSNLEKDSDASVLDLCSPEKPLLILIEDINRVNQTQMIIDNLISWIPGSKKKERVRCNWQVLCPIWPEYLEYLPSQKRDRSLYITLSIQRYSQEEASSAIIRQGEYFNREVTQFEANRIAEELGNDPLLIDLFDFENTKVSPDIIDNFIEKEFALISLENRKFAKSDYLSVLSHLAERMLSQRNLEPAWAEVRRWFPSESFQLARLSEIVWKGTVLSLVKSGNQEIVKFRHERIRSATLSIAIRDMLIFGQTDSEVFSDPFYAEEIGKAITDIQVKDEILEFIKLNNPLSLFYVLQKTVVKKDVPNAGIVSAIKDFLKSEIGQSISNFSLRDQALRILENIESPCVTEIVGLFKERSFSYYFALFVNGSLSAGIQICQMLEPGVNAPWRDLKIDFIKKKFKGNLINSLNNYLFQDKLNRQQRMGALRLAGYLTDERLSSAILYSWENDDGRLDVLDDYLFAAAQCCGNRPDEIIGPICAEWATISDEPAQKGNYSPRQRISADGLDWAFSRSISEPALLYFIERAKSEDLHWPITSMISHIDHPRAILHLVKKFADYEKDKEEGSFWPFISFIHDYWRRRQEQGRPMSEVVREELLKIWSDLKNEYHLRTQALFMWSATKKESDLFYLRNSDFKVGIENEIIRLRAFYQDPLVIQELLSKLKGRQGDNLWRLAKYIPSNEYIDLLENYLKGLKGGSDQRSNMDHAVSDLMMYLDPVAIGNLLLKYWEKIKDSSLYIQTALYFSNPSLLKLVEASVQESDNPNKLFEHIVFQWGIGVEGTHGVKNEQQLLVLVPYLSLLGDSQFSMLWDLCNKNGWLEFRREYLDGMVKSDKERKIYYLDNEDIRSALDRELKFGPHYSVDFFIENYLKANASLQALLSVAREWLDEKKSIEALNLIAQIIAVVGKRKDIEILKFDNYGQLEGGAQIVEDTKFVLYRRTLT
ncbi:hypothetical protein LEP1GSC066_3988 [Leptospira sp. serovar Kenya str. Sh9]|uniref:ATP-binding protein n=1 Tax=Leptospira sp. serovar Kenya TaxID=1242990 RepID=UPI0002BE6ACA|nr:ATP-binding protein [Leptospira sp. serovar Kenya]EMK12237.1 hypothetical protein LEP1GSC066_3988 [Leptospira sp. serovar Kenya str. Sh9]